MSTSWVTWSCSECKLKLDEQQPQHKACHAPTKWLCEWSKASGLYKNYKRHLQRFAHCSPDRLREIVAAEQADKENRLSATAESEAGQFALTRASNSLVDS